MLARCGESELENERKEQVLSLGRELHLHHYKPVTETARRNYWPPTATFRMLHSGEEWMLNEAVRTGAHLQYPICKALGRTPNNKYLLMFQRYGMRKFTAYDSARTVTKRVWREARLELQIRRGSIFWNSFPRRTHSGTAVSQVTSNATGHNLLRCVPGLFPRVKVRPHRTRSAAADCGLCLLRQTAFYVAGP